MIDHLQRYIGYYLVGLLLLPIIFDDPNDDYSIGIWIFAILLIMFMVPPFSFKDRFMDMLHRFYSWLFQIPLRWLSEAPRWVQILFAITITILFEELVFKPLGYTIYPWRMDFS
tara:strand:- start:757 stop:1098 length:342 start_codon:yes stop_codon:yes gene_type:complete